MNKVFEFFNKIMGFLVFLIFLIFLIGHLHRAHFWSRGKHKHYAYHHVCGDSTKIKTDSSAKK